jgi:hypothetical protein
MVEKKKLTYEEALQRPRCIIYELFEFLPPTKSYQKIEASRLMQDFLTTHPAPRTLRKHGVYFDVGQHTIVTLTTFVKDVMRNHSVKGKNRRHALKTLFEHRHHAVTWDYYQKMVQSYKDAHPDKIVENRRPSKEAVVQRKLHLDPNGQTSSGQSIAGTFSRRYSPEVIVERGISRTSVSERKEQQYHPKKADGITREAVELTR